MAMKNKSDSFILNEWWATGVPLGGAGGASGSSEGHLGEVGGSTIITTVTLTAGTTAYSANDIFADTQPIAGAMRVTGGKGVLDSLLVIDLDDQGVDFDFVLMQDHGSLGTENSAVTIADADALKVLGTVPVLTSDYVDLINSQVATLRNVGLPVQATAGTTSLHLGVITRGAPTLQTVDSVIVKLGWLRD